MIEENKAQNWAPFMCVTELTCNPHSFKNPNNRARASKHVKTVAVGCRAQRHYQENVQHIITFGYRILDECQKKQSIPNRQLTQSGEGVEERGGIQCL